MVNIHSLHELQVRVPTLPCHGMVCRLLCHGMVYFQPPTSINKSNSFRHTTGTRVRTRVPVQTDIIIITRSLASQLPVGSRPATGTRVYLSPRVHVYIVYGTVACRMLFQSQYWYWYCNPGNTTWMGGVHCTGTRAWYCNTGTGTGSMLLSTGMYVPGYVLQKHAT